MKLVGTIIGRNRGSVAILVQATRFESQREDLRNFGSLLTMAKSSSSVASSVEDGRGGVLALSTDELEATKMKKNGSFAGNIDLARVRKARSKVWEAMKDAQIALRFEYLVDKDVLKKKTKLQGDLATVPPCCNKYDMLGKDRLLELLCDMEPTLDIDTFNLCQLEDLKILVHYALAAARPHAVPSKIWGELKMNSKTRYGALGGNRLQELV